MSEFPEHDKLRKVAEASQAIGEFLDYGLGEQGLVLAERQEGSHRLWATGRSIQDILATYFQIDQTKLDDEKSQMVKLLQDMNKGV